MKYIKKFELVVTNDYEISRLSEIEKEYLEEYKFKLGDLVRYVGDEFFFYKNHNKKEIFKICALDVLSNKIDVGYRIHDLKGNFVRWVREEDLIKVEEYEIDAEKYNL